jgi:hypothetical protein
MRKIVLIAMFAALVGCAPKNEPQTTTQAMTPSAAPTHKGTEAVALSFRIVEYPMGASGPAINDDALKPDARTVGTVQVMADVDSSFSGSSFSNNTQTDVSGELQKTARPDEYRVRIQFQQTTKTDTPNRSQITTNVTLPIGQPKVIGALVSGPQTAKGIVVMLSRP